MPIQLTSLMTPMTSTNFDVHLLSAKKGNQLISSILAICAICDENWFIMASHGWYRTG